MFDVWWCARFEVSQNLSSQPKLQLQPQFQLQLQLQLRLQLQLAVPAHGSSAAAVAAAATWQAFKKVLFTPKTGPGSQLAEGPIRDRFGDPLPVSCLSPGCIQARAQLSCQQLWNYAIMAMRNCLEITRATWRTTAKTKTKTTKTRKVGKSSKAKGKRSIRRGRLASRLVQNDTNFTWLFIKTKVKQLKEAIFFYYSQENAMHWEKFARCLLLLKKLRERNKDKLQK